MARVGDFVRGSYRNGLNLITYQTLCIIVSLPEDKPNIAEVKILGATKEAEEYWAKYLKQYNCIGRKYMVSKSKLSLIKLRQATE